jgi:hypothetical protein
MSRQEEIASRVAERYGIAISVGDANACTPEQLAEWERQLGRAAARGEVVETRDGRRFPAFHRALGCTGTR